MLKISENPPERPPCVESVAGLAGRWWVAHTRARAEKAFAWDLLRRDIGYFLPLIDRVYVSGGKKRRVLIPLFPSYVFFCGSDDARSAAWRTNRICQVLPVAGQADLVAELASIERVLCQARLDPYPQLPAGRRCRIAAGPLAGIEGVVLRTRKGSTRIVLQVSSIALGAALDIDADLIEVLPGEMPKTPAAPRQDAA